MVASAGEPGYIGYGGGSGGAGRSQGLSDSVFNSLQKINKESSMVACECNHGLMVEALKKFMFTKN